MTYDEFAGDGVFALTDTTVHAAAYALEYLVLIETPYAYLTVRGNDGVLGFYHI